MERLKNVEWKQPLGRGLRITSNIADAVSGFCPFAGIVKGATTMVADMLDPPVTLDQIKELQDELLSLQKSNVSQTKEILSNQIEELKILYNKPKPEVRTDFSSIKSEMMNTLTIIKKENSEILSELSEMKDLVKKIFLITVQINYKVLQFNCICFNNTYIIAIF